MRRALKVAACAAWFLVVWLVGTVVVLAYVGDALV